MIDDQIRWRSHDDEDITDDNDGDDKDDGDDTYD